MSNKHPAAGHEDHVIASSSYAPPRAPSLLISADKKWIAVSQMQKAIRRAEPQIAVEWAHSLWHADRSYGLFRMGVIAAEEVAGANPALARGFLQSEIKREWFDERGGFNSFAYFVDAFARSAKDRTSCDLASTASLSHLQGVAAARGELDYAALRAVAEDVAKPTPARVSALWLLAGTKKSPNPQLGPERHGRLIHFLGACHSICPDADLLACIDLSLRLNTEPNPIALALCRAAQQEAIDSISLSVPSNAVGSGLSCAVDAHTREGREAIERLLASSPLAKDICRPMTSKADKSKLLGSIFFRLEGHEVSPRLSYALSEKAHAWHRRRLARLAERPEEQLFQEALSLLPALDALRMEAAPWAFSTTASNMAPAPAAAMAQNR